MTISLKLYGSQVLMVLATSVVGVLLSFQAQPGGINQTNAFIAPILGPWSKCLDPNAAPLWDWPMGYYWFAVVLTVALLLSETLSRLRLNILLKIATRVLAFLCVVAWCLAGLAKVILELS